MTPSKIALSLITLFFAGFAQAGFPPGAVTLESVTFAGSGCPAGSVNAVLAPDGSAITLLYDAFEAKVLGATSSAVKKCDVVIKLRKPQLYSFALEAADFRGFVGLEHGARATQQVKIETGSGKLGKLNLNLASQQWRGPISEDYILTAVKPVEGMKYLSCLQPNKKAELKVKSTITLENFGSGAEGQIAVDSVDGRLVQRYNLKWMNCIQVGIGVLNGLDQLFH